MDKLRDFYFDEKMFVEVFAFFEQELRTHAADCALAGMDTTHIAKTAQFITQTRNTLTNMFETKITNNQSKNESR
jgi:hypothetical protein